MSETTTEAPASGDESGYAADLAAMQAAEQAEAAPAPAETAPVATEPAAEPAQEPQKVPLATFLEEKKAAKAAREEADRARREALEAQQRFAAVLERLTAQAAPPKAPEPEIPSVDIDPVAHFKAKTEALERELAQVRQPIQQQQAIAQFTHAVQTAEAAFAAQTPDYWQAVQHLQGALAAEEMALGLSRGALAANIAETALRNGRNPAEAAYSLAKARGYAGPAAAAPAAPAPAPVETAQRQVETLARGAQAARGVAAAAGGAPAAQLTPSAIAAMSYDQFDALMSKDPGAFHRAFGVRS